MRVLLLLCAVVVAVSAATSANLRRELWENFKTTYGKSYKTALEDRNRMEIFFKNLQKIEEHNAKFDKGEVTFTMGTNKFADWTHEEFLATILPAKRSSMKRFVNHAKGMFVKPVGYKAPDSIDWRESGYVTRVKDQGNCGSCWAFSTTGAIEGSHFNATGDLIELSEQNLMDCTYDYGNAGCGGGYQEYAFQYVADNKGIDTEESYPYQERDGVCRYDAANNAASVTGYISILPRGDESVQLDAVATVGPISVSMDASKETFQLYKSGIYYDPLCKNGFFELDHGVLAVGYGTDSDGNDFWIIKNSWGTSWGEDGYFNMARNRDNNCGIATDSMYGIGAS